VLITPKRLSDLFRARSEHGCHPVVRRRQEHPKPRYSNGSNLLGPLSEGSPMKNTPNYYDDLHKHLKDPKNALDYLNACLEDDERVFLLALRHVAEAHGGLRKLAQKSRLNREHLFRMLSKRGNPRLETIRQLADVFGWRMAFVPKGSSKLRRAA